MTGRPSATHQCKHTPTHWHSHATSLESGAACWRSEEVQRHVWVKFEPNNAKVVASVIKDWSSMHKLIIYNTTLTFQHTSTDIYPDFNLYYVYNHFLFSLSMNLPIVLLKERLKTPRSTSSNCFFYPTNCPKTQRLFMNRQTWQEKQQILKYTKLEQVSEHRVFIKGVFALICTIYCSVYVTNCKKWESPSQCDVF